LGNEIPEGLVIFLKPNSAIGTVLHSVLDEPLHYEGELCFSVVNNALAGVGFGLDLTKRSLQSRLKAKGLPWEKAKAFDGAALFSEFVALPENIEDIELSLDINGRRVQQGGFAQMIYKPAEILAHILSFMSLNDGDVIMTGTPAGVGEVKKGDEFVGCVSQQKQPLLSARCRAL
jgi:2-keto-4-pentenoate hydratase/2-oxohepta-3-ene-1,7-dioic acid hydratase in catechol pathway